MGGQVLGGGIVFLVAVLLWLVYLLPSWHQRHQYDAAERNAVRLNQALRVLAETSETPDEVRLELSARTALAQQKIARRAQAEREQLARKAQTERERLAHDAQLARDRVARRELVAREQAALVREQAEVAERRAGLEAAREQAARQRRLLAERERAVAASVPAPDDVRRGERARLARVRRRARLTTTVIGVLGLALAAWGAYLVLATGAAWAVWAGGALVVVCTLMLVRMARVGARSEGADARVAASRPARARHAAQDISLGDERAWQPRELPRPLTASAGSRAAAVLDAAAQRENLRQAALDEPLHERAVEARPAELDTARVARMGHIDDAEIEQHVRELLASRAAV